MSSTLNLREHIVFEQIGWGNRHNVGSKDNPYITRKKEMYTETIHPQVLPSCFHCIFPWFCDSLVQVRCDRSIAPQKIVQGIMQIREQLVVEWIDDLALLEEEDQVFLEELVS